MTVCDLLAAIAGMFFRTPPALYTTALVLMVLPGLLFLAFALVGRTIRGNRLRELFSREAKVGDVVADHPTVDPDMQLGEFLQQEYDEGHRLRRFVVPLGAFHLVYLFGLYWSCIAFSFIIEPQNAIWTATERGVLQVVAVGAAGFIGSAAVVLWHFFWRTMRIDLQPRTFTHFVARLAVSPILAVVVAKGIPIEKLSENGMLFVAFGCGMATEFAFRLIASRWGKTVGQDERQSGMSGELPLQNLQGLTSNDELRLWEEGISDCEHLAVERVDRLLINTNYPLERIVDWKDQAFLYVYVRDELPKWRQVHMRGALDILGLAPVYYGEKRYNAICVALATTLQKERAIVERFIDTIYNDPRAHQLWKYLKQAYPTEPAEPIVAPQGEERDAPGEEPTGWVIITPQDDDRRL